jgi:Zn finger protein HypA/HybF involved in hydrogenase expression
MKMTKSQEWQNQLRAINETRRNVGMKELEKVERQCLRCDFKFTSWQRDVRLCYNCRGQRSEV